MHLSYWEQKEWFSNLDFVIVGSGIVGLSCAINLKKKYPKAKIIILEKGVLPQGASTKNAGFACFGSASELLSDLENHTEEEVLELVKKRWEGLLLLRKTLGDSTIDYQPNKGFEIFQNKEEFDLCVSHINKLNDLVKPIFSLPVYSVCSNQFQFKNVVPNYIVNHFEGQIDTGKMMASLLSLAQKKGIRVLNSIQVKSFSDDSSGVKLLTNLGQISSKKLIVAANGFARQLDIENVEPARAQVLITKPIKNLAIKGTFHLDQGFYYFRNIDNRILLGGGRNLDFKTEQTTDFGTTEIIQSKLEELLKEVILPNQSFEIEIRWSGIMGVGNQKKAIVKQMSDNVFCGVRLGGMGVAIGSLVGKEVAKLIE